MQFLGDPLAKKGGFFNKFFLIFFLRGTSQRVPLGTPTRIPPHSLFLSCFLSLFLTYLFSLFLSLCLNYRGRAIFLPPHAPSLENPAADQPTIGIQASQACQCQSYSQSKFRRSKLGTVVAPSYFDRATYLQPQHGTTNILVLILPLNLQDFGGQKLCKLRISMYFSVKWRQTTGNRDCHCDLLSMMIILRYNLGFLDSF